MASGQYLNLEISLVSGFSIEDSGDYIRPLANICFLSSAGFWVFHLLSQSHKESTMSDDEILSLHGFVERKRRGGRTGIIQV